MQKKTYFSGLVIIYYLVTNTTPVVAASSTAATVAVAPASTESRVRDYFKDAPDMIEIAHCESKFRQLADSGSVLRGGAGGGMVGVFQFYERIHAGSAKALGLNLSTLEGNLAYARHIYNSQGTTPWDSSSDCWQKTSYPTVVASTVLRSSEANRTKLLEQIASLTKLIALLQKQLAAQRVLALK